MLGAKKVPTATLPVIIENKAVSRLLSGLIGALSASAIRQKRSFLADKKGQAVASPQLTVVDDPLWSPGWPANSTTATDSPRAGGRFSRLARSRSIIDWYYSRKLGWQPTTGSAQISDPARPPLRRSDHEDLGRGILITGFLGGNSNSTTGDFSVGISGTLFENGQPAGAVAEMNIADNHLSFWNKLAEVANDPWQYSSWRTPSLVFQDVVVAGA